MTGTSVDSFLDELAHQRRASPHTLAAYGHDLARLTGLAGERALSDLAPHQLRRFVMQLHGQGLAAGSLARAVAAGRVAGTWGAAGAEIWGAAVTAGAARRMLGGSNSMV